MNSERRARPRKYLAEVIAHRGFSGRAPENTLGAFEEAVRVGADRVELDVQITRDGSVVVIHDSTLDRTTGGKGPVSRRTLEEIRALDAGSWLDPRFRGERVPTLDEVLAFSKGRIPVNVELKGESALKGRGNIERKVAEAIEKHGLLDTATVSSFSPPALERIRALHPAIVRETLHDSEKGEPGPAALDAARVAGSRSFNLSLEELRARPSLVEEAHARGLRLKVYTVDAPEDLLWLLRLGVDGIFTNRPDTLLALLEEP